MIKQDTQGLRENWKQFLLLVLINAFVGGMVGLERTILPEIAEKEFLIASQTAILSFIVVFGITKSVSNYYAGYFANKIGRRKLLILGWIFGIPVPLVLMFASNWNWIVVANIFLGINQGLAWSSTVVMKIDLVGERNRGLAMGLNESAGYLAVGASAFLTGYLAANYGLRPYPFYLGIVLIFLGLFSSIVLLKDTKHHVKNEARTSEIKILKGLFKEVSFKNKNLGSITQAGLVNNLNDAMIWGILPILLAANGFDLKEIALLVSVYPTVWGISQLVSGKLADHLNQKYMLVVGMVAQGIAILSLTIFNDFQQVILISILLGLGTSIVYPTFLVGISKFTHPSQRAEGIGIFRLWRDMGYAIGAVLVGILADIFSPENAIMVVGVVTILSGILIWIRMDSSR